MLKHWFGFILFVGFCAPAFSTSSQAAPALVVLIDNGDDNLAYRHFMEAFGYVVTTNQLGKKYDVISVLSGVRATGPELFREIRKRATKRLVDVVILSHGLPGKLAFTLGDLTKEQIEKEEPIAHLRMVYMMACHGATLVNSWKKIGATSIVGHQNVNSLVPFFFPRFLANWAQGMFVDDAALQAHRVAISAARSVSPFVKDQEDYISEKGIQKSYPVIVGENSNIDGAKVYPSIFLRGIMAATEIQSLRSGVMKSAVAEIAATLIPQVQFDPDLFNSPQNLIDSLKPTFWGSLQTVFPSHVSENFSQIDSESVWMDGDSLRLMADPLREWAGGQFATVMDRLQGVRLDPLREGLRVTVYSDRFVDFNLESILNSSSRKRALGQPLNFHLPKTIRLNVSVQDGIIRLQGFDQGVDSLILTVSGPLGTEWKVWPRLVELDLESGKLRVQVAVIGNSLSLWAEGDLMAKKLIGFSFWDSIESNLPVFEWPTLRFQPQ